jgi:hypothetical protein
MEPDSTGSGTFLSIQDRRCEREFLLCGRDQTKSWEMEEFPNKSKY